MATSFGEWTFPDALVRESSLSFDDAPCLEDSGNWHEDLDTLFDIIDGGIDLARTLAADDQLSAQADVALFAGRAGSVNGRGGPRQHPPALGAQRQSVSLLDLPELGLTQFCAASAMAQLQHQKKQTEQRRQSMSLLDLLDPSELGLTGSSAVPAMEQLQRQKLQKEQQQKEQRQERRQQQQEEQEQEQQQQQQDQRRQQQDQQQEEEDDEGKDEQQEEEDDEGEDEQQGTRPRPAAEGVVLGNLSSPTTIGFGSGGEHFKDPQITSEVDSGLPPDCRRRQWPPPRLQQHPGWHSHNNPGLSRQRYNARLNDPVNQPVCWSASHPTTVSNASRQQQQQRQQHQVYAHQYRPSERCASSYRG